MRRFSARQTDNTAVLVAATPARGTRCDRQFDLTCFYTGCPMQFSLDITFGVAEVAGLRKRVSFPGIIVLLGNSLLLLEYVDQVSFSVVLPEDARC